ncbi:protein of unknown function DUF4283 [Macleaya cordata]|uniref:DUF4283 domain-containing protein n=1 Tax=Macleaya cordata TaxID=56857 RepID=A0A200Q8R8_MACCD|nr:protein of unknown function DUF4283 [Macleaya cordata]
MPSPQPFSSGEGPATTSFADKIRHQQHYPAIDLSSLPSPGKRGDYPAISIPEDLYKKCLDQWKYNLIGRLDFQKLKFEDAKLILLELWNLSGSCKFILLGKGYFAIKLDNENDKRKVWSGGPWSVDSQYLRVRDWVPNFNPEN